METSVTATSQVVAKPLVSVAVARKDSVTAWPAANVALNVALTPLGVTPMTDPLIRVHETE